MSAAMRSQNGVLAVYAVVPRQKTDQPAYPLAGWTFSRKDQVKEDDVDPFSPEEQRAILGTLDGQAKNLVQFAFWTGMRMSELVALDWSDVDWLKAEIYVTRAMTQAAGGEAEVTKTLSGKRRIKLLAPAMEALITQKAHTFLAGNEVFQNPRTLVRWKGDQPIRKPCGRMQLRSQAFGTDARTRHDTPTPR